MNKRNILIFSRISLFIIYFWFGLLKVVGDSPANPLVSKLLEKTMPFLTFEQFIIAFGIFEMVIGILFLVGKFKRITSILFVFHMITTFMPLLLLKAATWSAPWVPTLEGQYIIKNLALIAVYLHIYRRD